MGDAVDHGAGPAALLEVPVVVAAEQGEVVEVGVAAVGPGEDVVALAPLRWMGAGGEGAAGVAGDEGEGLGAGGDAAGAAEVEDGAVGVEQGGSEFGLVGESDDVGGGDADAVGGGAVAGPGVEACSLMVMITVAGVPPASIIPLPVSPLLVWVSVSIG